MSKKVNNLGTRSAQTRPEVGSCGPHGDGPFVIYQSISGLGEFVSTGTSFKFWPWMEEQPGTPENFHGLLQVARKKCLFSRA